MKTICDTIYVPLIVAMFLCGCATERDIDDLPLQHEYNTRAEQEDMDTVQLPVNYSVDNLKKLQLGVAFSVKSADGGLKIDPALSGRLQTEMAKLKRFTVFSMHNRNGVKAFERIADMDESVKLDESTDVKNINLILNGTMTITGQAPKPYRDYTEYIYVADCDFSIENLKTRTVVLAETARGVWTRRVRYGGIGKMEDIGEDVAIQTAALRALAEMAKRIGNALPTGGRITTISGSGETMAMSAGYNEGIGAKQQVAIFLSEEGLDIPLAFAEAAPKNDGTSMLSVYKWNTGHKDAKPIIKELQESPRKFLKNYKGEKKDGIFAVAFGMPVPPDWEKQGPAK